MRVQKCERVNEWVSEIIDHGEKPRSPFVLVHPLSTCFCERPPHRLHHIWEKRERTLECNEPLNFGIFDGFSLRSPNPILFIVLAQSLPYSTFLYLGARGPPLTCSLSSRQLTWNLKSFVNPPPHTYLHTSRSTFTGRGKWKKGGKEGRQSRKWFAKTERREADWITVFFFYIIIDLAPTKRPS